MGKLIFHQVGIFIFTVLGKFIFQRVGNFTFHLQLLLWSLLLRRIDRPGEQHQLLRAMLRNINLIPFILGETLPTADIRHGNNFAEAGHLDYLPGRVIEAIQVADRDWIHDRYHSETFQRILGRHIEIEVALSGMPVGDERSRLVEELFRLREMI